MPIPLGGSLLGPLLLESECCVGDLMPLREGPRLRKEFAGYTRMEVTVDSGVAASVIPEKLLPGHAIRPSEGSKAGVHYLAADGGRIPNLGEVEVAFLTKEQHRCRMAFQVANVKRPPAGCLHPHENRQ